jgi:hypothetical protein
MGMKGRSGFLFVVIIACFQLINVFPQTIHAQTRALENPQAGSFQSGIGVISGWTCTANVVEIVIDNASPLPAGYGTTRGDTSAVCGDANNGFGLLWNWNLSGPGQLVDHGSVQLNPGASLNFGVLFRPTSPRTFAGRLTVIINSDGSDSAEVFLSGTGSGPDS